MPRNKSEKPFDLDAPLPLGPEAAGFHLDIPPGAPLPSLPGRPSLTESWRQREQDVTALLELLEEARNEASDWRDRWMHVRIPDDPEGRDRLKRTNPLPWETQ
jgi:hypothetical protein